MAKYHHKESDMQIRCVKYFRVTYPAFAYLLFHPHNEGNAFNRQQQITANREGVTKGVADLIMLLPSMGYHSLAIELKYDKGKQSKEQVLFQRYFEASGGKYVVVRSYDDFVEEIDNWMKHAEAAILHAVTATYRAIDKELMEEAKRELQKLIGKK